MLKLPASHRSYLHAPGANAVRRRGGRLALATLVAFVGAAGAALVAPRAAHADCGPPTAGRVVWMWPAPDAVDANPEEGFSLFAFSGYTGVPPNEFQVLLNGIPWESGAREGERSDPLEPDTRYDVEVQLNGAPAYTASFTTGAARPLPESLPAPTIASVTAANFGESPAERPYTRECGDLFFDAGCYDTFPRDTLVVELAADVSRPWSDNALRFHTRSFAGPTEDDQLEQTRLPGAVCGPMVSHGGWNYTLTPCVQVRYQVPDGRYSEWSEMVCAEDWGGRPVAEVDADAASSPDSDADLSADTSATATADGADETEEVGCAAAGTGRSYAGGWLLIAALVACRRLPRSRRSSQFI